MNDDEDDNCSSQDADTSSSNQALSASPVAIVSKHVVLGIDTCLRVQEGIYIEALGRMCEVGKSKIKCEQDDDKNNVDPRMRKRSRNHNLRKGHNGVECML
jgi:hypothetical protein